VDLLPTDLGHVHGSSDVGVLGSLGGRSYGSSRVGRCGSGRGAVGSVAWQGAEAQCDQGTGDARGDPAGRLAIAFRRHSEKCGAARGRLTTANGSY
jgi:hypothetical protein